MDAVQTSFPKRDTIPSTSRDHILLPTFRDTAFLPTITSRTQALGIIQELAGNYMNKTFKSAHFAITNSRSMAHSMHVTFLGTASGGGPSDTRNCSSLVADIGRGSLWMFDCAEGTLRQFSCQPYSNQPRLSVNNISKMFITHMHGASLSSISWYPYAKSH